MLAEESRRQGRAEVTRQCGWELGGRGGGCARTTSELEARLRVDTADDGVVALPSQRGQRPSLTSTRSSQTEQS
jgi:hypothetical protein